MNDIDRHREPAGNGFIYRFSNGFEPSIIADPHRPLRFEIYVPGEIGREITRHLGGDGGGLLVGLTTEQAETKLAQIAALPRLDPDDPNPAVLAEFSTFDGAPPILTFRDGSQQYGPYTA
jgi:hypothetical protein